MDKSPKSSKRVKWLVAALAVVLLFSAAAFACFVWPGFAGDRTLTGPKGSSFTMDYPGGWEKLSGAELAAQPGSPLAVLENRDGGGTVVVRRGGRPAVDLARYAKQLGPQLKKRFKDFKPVSARVVRVKSGPALLYSFARTIAGTANSIVLVPDGQRSYVIDTVSVAGANETAIEIGKMIRSFSAGN